MIKSTINKQQYLLTLKINTKKTTKLSLYSTTQFLLQFAKQVLNIPTPKIKPRLTLRAWPRHLHVGYFRQNQPHDWLLITFTLIFLNHLVTTLTFLPTCLFNVKLIFKPLSRVLRTSNNEGGYLCQAGLGEERLPCETQGLPLFVWGVLMQVAGCGDSKILLYGGISLQAIALYAMPHSKLWRIYVKSMHLNTFKTCYRHYLAIIDGNCYVKPAV